MFGTELSLGLSAPQNGVADPEGTHLLLLARDPEGYRALCRTVSAAQLRGGEKGRPVYDLDELVAHTAGHVLALTGCRKGAVRQALHARRRRSRARSCGGCASGSGPSNVAVELTHAGLPTDTERNDALAALAADAGLPTVVTTAAHYATPARYPLATALAAVRARRSLDDADGWLPPGGHRPPALRRRAHRPLRAPPPGRGGARGARSGASARSRSGWWRPTCRRSRCRRGRPR